jgi:hypothetical protein
MVESGAFMLMLLVCFEAGSGLEVCVVLRSVSALKGVQR